MLRLAIVGGAGRMGQTMAEGLGDRPDMTVVALVDIHEPRERFGAVHVTSVNDLPADLDAVIDFSLPESVVATAAWCVAHGVALVIGATGLTSQQRAAVEAAGEHVGVVMAANYSIGAVLSERFAAMAAPYFERVEIIELHHDRKVDAPSGTSLVAAERIRLARATAGRTTAPDPTERLTLEGARGADAGDGVRIHSVRLPGLLAHQEVLFGSAGEGLTIRHDSYDRRSFVSGVSIAIHHAVTSPGFTSGIDELL
jgi:4-hydroxy-tetrahydrodipicolinate reductase